MNVINLISRNICTLLIFLSTCFFSSYLFASASHLLPNDIKVPNDLDSINTTFESNDGWFIGGYKIIDESNAAVVVFVPNDESAIKYWSLDTGYVSQFFKVNDSFYVLSSAGEALKIEKDRLVATSYKVKPKSTLIVEEPYLIACHPRGWAKLSSVNTGSCYRLDGVWDIDLSWTHIGIPPKLCDGNLKVLITTNKSWSVVSIDLETGETLQSRKVAKPKSDVSLCEL